MLRILQKLQRFSSIRDRIKLERESRLNRGHLAQNLTTKTLEDIEKIRNIGIIAHIDAGKTTTTQRMLYYAGALPSPGNIDEGTTAMDYLVQQRQRGITIRSAAISFNWKETQLNLIDTPGHVDFSGQVTRSLQVLDGVVTILDAVKGVEPQTKKVWANASMHNLPKICYLNKMDRIGVSIPAVLKSMKQRLDTTPLLLQTAVGDGDTFKGVIDLIEMQEVVFNKKYGQEVVRSKITKNTEKHNHYIKMRNQLIESISDFDDQMTERYLSDEYISGFQIKKCLRKIMISHENRSKISPVLLGTSYRNKGVQLLLDAICDYLPSPKDQLPITCESSEAKRLPDKDQPFTAYVFKVLYDSEKGPLAYSRIFSGKLDKNQQIYNSTKRITEKVNQILRVRSNTYLPIQNIGTGDIVALTGLTETSAGDTLTLGSDEFSLPMLNVPTPVFTAPFELTSNKMFRQFEEAMKKAVVEDSSLVYKYQKQTNQYLVSGLGQLHLQILRDRLKGEGIPIKMGNLKINFKETISQEIQDSYEIKTEIKPSVYEEFVLTLRVMPLRDENAIEEKNDVMLMFDKVAEFDAAWNEFLRRKNLKNLSKAEQRQKGHSLKKIVRNPTPIEPLEEDEDEQYQEGENEEEQSEDEFEEQIKQKDEEPYYHINTLPFESLYELVESCKISALYGKHNLPTMGIQIQILDGKYRKSSYSKSVMNRCASLLTRKLIEKSAILIQPMMQFVLTGEEKILEIALKDILKKRGRVDTQQSSTMTGVIPAEGVRGWIKEVRSMGLEIELKLQGYEEVSGINPEKLLEDNV